MKQQLIFGIAYQIPLAFTEQQIKERFMALLAPLIKMLYHSPHVQVALYISGHQLWWIEHRHPEYITVLKEMVDRKQIEMLGGGFYDPIPSLIPRSDSIGQIEMSTAYIRKLFRKRSNGIWLYDQIWDPTYPLFFFSCNMQYTFLKDSSLLEPSIALRSNPVITEYEGRTVTIFLTNSQIFTLWQSGRPRRVINALREMHATNSVAPITLFDVADPVLPFSRYERLFSLLQSNSSWLESVLPRKVWQSSERRPRGYFFSKSADLLRNSLIRHPRHLLMYAKMQHVHILVNLIRGDKYRKKSAQEILWQSQNCFSYVNEEHKDNLSLLSIRKAYSYLIEAEHHSHAPGVFATSIQCVDCDFDGIKEYLFHGKHINAYLHRLGGSIFELDFFPSRWNWIDGAHEFDGQFNPEHLTKQMAESSLIANAFVDYIMPIRSRVQNFDNIIAREAQLSGQLYEEIKVNREHASVELRAQWYVEAPENAIEIIKIYHFDSSSIQVDYQLVNRCNIALRCSFASQIGLTPSLKSDDSIELRGQSVKGHSFQIGKKSTVGRFPNVVRVEMTVPSYKHAAEIECSGSDELWYQYAVRYHRYSFIPRWHLHLGPNDTRSLRVSLGITRLKGSANSKGG